MHKKSKVVKKIKVFDCGPCVANTKVELYVFDDRDPKSLKKAMAQLTKPVQRIGAGVTIFDPWLQSCAKEPIKVLINSNRKKKLKAVQITLPHEINHIAGFLAKKFCTDSGSEPIAYLVGYMTESFQSALLKELGFEIIEKEAK